MCCSLAENAVKGTNLQPVINQYMGEMDKRFGWLAKQINEKIVEDKFLGGSLVTNAYDYPLQTKKIEGFMKWLAAQEDKGILEIISYEGRGTVVHSGWQNTYVKRSYSKGVVWAEKRMNELGIAPPETDAAISAVLGGAVHADALGSLYLRNFSELNGITGAMDQKISRVLADGMANGMNPRAIASELAGKDGVVKKLGLARARVLARTETARAFDEATLNRYTDFKVEAVEWIFGGGPCPSQVCPDGAAGSPYKIGDARGLIPAHPNCTCAWGPLVGDMAREVNTLKTKEDVSRWLRRQDVDGNMDGFSDDVAVDVAKALDGFQKRYPVIADGPDGVKFFGNLKLPGLDDIADDVYGRQFNHLAMENYEIVRGRAVQLNPKWFKNRSIIDKQYMIDEATGFHPIGTANAGGARAITTHELSHVLEVNLPHDAWQDARRIYLNTSSKDIATKVSRYAAKNEQEFFAESMTEYLLSDSPRAMAKAVGKIVDAALR